MKEKNIERNLRVIESVSQVNILADRENVSFVAGENSGSGSGSGSIAGSGHCFYDCLESLGRKYKVRDADGGYMRYTDFRDCYPGDEKEREVGPYTRTNVKDEFGNPVKDESGNNVTEPNPTAHSFINNYFETKDDSWQEKPEKIQDYVNNNYGENRGQILAVIGGVQGSRNSHALFIESYDSANNEYICNDPNIMGPIRIPASQVLYATKILGKKTEEQH